MAQYDGPKLGATFIPGSDDFYMPAHIEIVSPSPQRLTPEVPEQIQNNIAALELDATQVPKADNRKTSLPDHRDTVKHDNQIRRASEGAAPDIQTQVGTTSSKSGYDKPAGSAHPQSPFEIPNFSAFPKLTNKPPNVPLSDDEREKTLESARAHVLGATDPEMQLSWAQDCLTYVDIALEDERRVSSIMGNAMVVSPVVQQLKSDALSIVNFLADQHHPRADFIRGTWLEFGKFGLSQDKPEAFRCYKRASERGYARAFYRQGMLFESTSEPVQALQNYANGEAAGDAASCYRIGMMALLGQLGQPQDYRRAVRLIQHAADNADENAPQGAYVFGMLQARELPQIAIPDTFLPFDIDSARRYIEKSAFLGFSKAQLKMGSAYELCTLHCEFNPTLSLHYNALAARQGEAEAELAISKWFLCGYEGLFRRSDELAFKYAQRAAESSLATAEFAMGYFHEIGIYVKVDLEKAVNWYEKARQQGNTDAEDRIKGIRASQTLSRQDHESVAITRLKSQHGSRRGGRPERTTLPNSSQRLPAIQDESVLRASSTTPYPPTDAPPRPATTSNQPHIRPSSVAPYPPDERPVSTAPYPLDDPRRPNANPRPGQTTGFLMVDSSGRPKSAGGYRPPPSNLNANSPRPPPRQGPGPSLPNSYPGRSYPGKPLQQVAHNGRLPNAGPPPRPAKERLPPPQPEQPSIPKLDIGFVAPLDVRGAARNRTQSHTPSTLNSSQHSATSQGMQEASSPSSIYSPRSAGSAHAQERPINTSLTTLTQQTTSGPTASPAIRPPRLDSSHNQAPTAPIGPPPTSITPSQQSAPRPNTSKPSAGGKTQSGLPGKGPKTFDEMGVPVGKQDNDCVVM